MRQSRSLHIFWKVLRLGVSITTSLTATSVVWDLGPRVGSVLRGYSHLGEDFQLVGLHKVSPRLPKTKQFN